MYVSRLKIEAGVGKAEARRKISEARGGGRTRTTNSVEARDGEIEGSDNVPGQGRPQIKMYSDG